jgi:hypothetical protein
MDKQSDLTLYEFTITKKALMDIDEHERMFFVLLGFASNEIIILYKVVLAIEVFQRDAEDIENQAWFAQRNFISRLLIAKMFEAWEKLFQQLFFRNPLGREYELVFSQKAKESCAELRKFFGRTPYLAAVRNHYVFHYPSHELNAAMPNIPDDEDWKIYVSETVGNSLYYLSEMVASHAISAEINPDRFKGYDKMFEDRDFLAHHIIELCTGCMSVFVKRHLGLRMEDGMPISIKVPGEFDVKLPFFTGLVPEKYGTKLDQRSTMRSP